ncbi:2-C-methyl-D-erythritol 2,4-cyclodiphosphate synthase [Spiroplasma endosymbiont of Amphibalanus improvisus]|uniref:2-C-methyl-D-erythritol 2,4-cyclodiphosphate synthase n=1 Tax=Spiroplasma endosymbiont of Amphibalanus improvisus TaxID=3066327 RepID=UPI00313CE8D3
MKIGHSYDLHKLKNGDFILLGGVKIPCEYSVISDSDGDVLLHTISESILGALGLGDLGDYFNEKGIKSINILNFCLNKLKENKYHIVNIDNIIVLDNPKLSQYKLDIKFNLAKLMNINHSNINIKATTSEQTKLTTIESFSNILIEKDEGI